MEYFYTFNIPGTMLGALHIFSYLILTTLRVVAITSIFQITKVKLEELSHAPSHIAMKCCA